MWSNTGNGCPLDRAQITEAGHPTPDESGFRGAAKVLELAQKAGQDDCLVCLFSGGASALLVDGPEGVTMAEVIQLHELLVKCGANIGEINAVRKHLSRIKGGQLARAAQPARVFSFILSDVIGDPIDVIASGPTAPDSSTFGDAFRVVEKYGLQHSLAESLTRHLLAGASGAITETPKAGNPIFRNTSNCVIGNNRVALEACQKKAAEMGFDARIVSDGLSGDAELAARKILADAREARAARCLLYGGETTVRVRGSGLGGRSQHLALAAAIGLTGTRGITLLAAGTDGSDGPTDAAGAVVDAETMDRASGLGLDAPDFLRRFDSHGFFQQAGGHVKTGPTRTNVMDIVIVLTSEDYA